MRLVALTLKSYPYAVASVKIAKFSDTSNMLKVSVHDARPIDNSAAHARSDLVENPIPIHEKAVISLHRFDFPVLRYDQANRLFTILTNRKDGLVS